MRPGIEASLGAERFNFEVKPLWSATTRATSSLEVSDVLFFLRQNLNVTRLEHVHHDIIIMTCV